MARGRKPSEERCADGVLSELLKRFGHREPVCLTIRAVNVSLVIEGNCPEEGEAKGSLARCGQEANHVSSGPPTAHSHPVRPSLLMTRSVHDAILAKLTSMPPEAGGALVGPRDHPIVTHFIFDERATVSPTTYQIDSEGLNDYVQRSRPFGLGLKGLVHSHPEGFPAPSSADVAYVARAFANPLNRIEQYLFPIVCDGVLYPYVFSDGESAREVGRRGGRPVLELADLVLV